MSWECTDILNHSGQGNSLVIPIESWEITDQPHTERERFSPSVVIQPCQKERELKSIEEILEEYSDASRKKRDQLWLMYVDLRRDFEEIEHNARENSSGFLREK